MLATVLKLLILSLIFVKAPYSWGFSFDRTQSYLKNAQKLKLSESKKWLKLGHYEPSRDGYKSPFVGPFFIASQGALSPQAELEKSIEALFSESTELTQKFKMHPQCRFLARRNWLIKMLEIQNEDILPCLERANWKANLNAKEVALIFAASDLGNASSSFGHTFLKLINPTNTNNKDLIDYGVNYAAATDASEGFLYAMKGLFGFYPGQFTILPYHQKIRDYINLEGRDIWEYRLNFNEDEVDELINHLLEFEGSGAPYFYLTGNCSYHILATFEAIRPELNLTEPFKYFVIPVDTVKVISRSTNLITDRKFKKSLKSDYLQSYILLNQAQRSALIDTINQRKELKAFNFDKKEEAEVLEAAMKFYAIKAYRTNQDFDHQIHQLSVSRAKLGLVTQASQVNRQEPPELSHDSSALSLGAGELNTKNFQSIRFRHAFHDLEQSDFGAVPRSHYEVLSFDLRYFPDQSLVRLHKLTFINLLNTSPVSPLESPISWRARLDFFQGWMPDGEAGAGYSVDLFPELRASALLAARYSYLDLSDKRNFFQLGPSILLVSRPLKQLGVSADITYFSGLKNQSYTRLIAKLDYEIIQQWDLQVGFEKNYGVRNINSVFFPEDFQVRILKNFIF